MGLGEVKARVQDAHRRALERHNTWMSREAGIHRLTRDLRLFGRDAGADFVATNLDAIVAEAVATAGCKQASLEIPVHGFGKAAVEGMVQALRELTALDVESDAFKLTLTWGNSV